MKTPPDHNRDTCMFSAHRGRERNPRGKADLQKGMQEAHTGPIRMTDDAEFRMPKTADFVNRGDFA